MVQRGSTATNTGAKGKGLRHSTQFKYYIEVEQSADPMIMAAEVYRLACRTNFAAPGFALLRLNDVKSSVEQRQTIVQLKESLSTLHRALVGQSIGWFSLNRFDQKSTTRPHRDAGPAQSLLILGYEPSPIKSDLWIGDYSACAHELGLSPVQFLEEFNPMYDKGLSNLAPYIIPVAEFDNNAYNILIINNSSAALDRQQHHWQGVLHNAELHTGNLKKIGARRIINSTCVAPLEEGDNEGATAEEVENFVKKEKLDEAY